MKLVIPVSRHDINALPNLIDTLIHFGGLTEHSCFLFSTPSVLAQVHEQAERLKSVMPDVVVVQSLYEPEYGMPMDGGILFFGAVFNLGRAQNPDPFLWLEVDSSPLVAGWLDLIQNDYRAKGMPCYGNVVPLPFNVNGKLEMRPGEEYMMAVGVYPPYMHKDEAIRPLIQDLGNPPSSNPKENFDTYIRGGVKKVGWANSELIADMWNTHDYKQTPEGIECSPVATDKLVRPRGGLIPATAVLVHGCKDESLRKLVTAGKNTKLTFAKLIQVDGNVSKTQVMEALKKLVDGDKLVPEAPAKVEESFIASQINMKLGRGSYRLTDLAKDIGFVGTDLNPLKADVIAAGFKVAGPGWITKKAEEVKAPVAVTAEVEEEDPLS